MKQIIRNYSFDTTAKTVTFNDFSSVSIDRLLLITNVTANTVIYQFNNTALGGSAAGNVVALAYNTAGMNNGDKLQIIYNCAKGDPVYGAAQLVGGDVGSGAADAGNPVKIGGKYNVAALTLSDGQRGDIQLDLQGRLKTTSAPLAASIDSVTAVGDVASASTDSGNPVKIGGHVTTALPTFANGQRAEAQFDSNGRLHVTHTGTITAILNTNQFGGYATYRLLAEAGTNSNVVKSSGGRLYGWAIANLTASVKFVKFYNKASVPNIGTDTPAQTIPVPPNGTIMFSSNIGVTFTNGIGVGITGGVADSDTTAVVANDVIINAFYA